MSDYPFLYLGEGDAGYFEWLDFFVLFEREPTLEEKKWILTAVPPPIDDGGNWDGSMLSLGGGQFINVEIAQAYEPSDGEEPELDDFLGMIAATSQCLAFEQDIIRWLREVHKVVPVVVAVKPEDSEAGGTQLGDWHAGSVEKIPEAIFSRFVENEPDLDSSTAYLLARSFEFYRESGAKDIPDPMSAWYARWRDNYNPDGTSP